METIFMNTENRKTNEPHKFGFNLSQRLDLRSSDKHFALRNLSIYYKWKNIRKQYKNNKLKITALTKNDKLELPDGSYSVSDIQGYIEFIIKKHETLTIHSFFYKQTGKLGWNSIWLRFSQFEPEIMLDGMLNFKTHFMDWYCVWYKHYNGLF